MNVQDISKKGAVTAMVAIALLVGAAGGSALRTNSANAQSVSTTPAPSSPSTPAQGSSGSNAAQGTFKSNENPAHEARESAQWEAQENAGQALWQHHSVNGSQ